MLKPKGGCPTCTSGFGHAVVALSLVIDRSHSGLGDNSTLTVPLGSLPAGSSAVPVTLRIIVDASVLEVFVNGGEAAVATRVYPSSSASTGVQLFSAGGADATVTVDSWVMTPAAR